MRKEKQSSRSFKNKLLVAVIVFLFAVVIIASFFGKKGLIEVYSAQKEKEALLREIERLEQKKSHLEQEIKELESNPKAYEAKARDKLGLVYPDELVIIEPAQSKSKDKDKVLTSKKNK
ncbi:MAG: septum formation initiator family protein [Candidatus Aminicenantes bacterium]|jgi:cell division protein FtsB